MDEDDPFDEEEAISLSDDEETPLDDEGEDFPIDVLALIEEPAPDDNEVACDDVDEVPVGDNDDEDEDESRPFELLLPTRRLSSPSASFPTADELVTDEQDPVATRVSLEFEHCARCKRHLLVYVLPSEPHT